MTRKSILISFCILLFIGCQPKSKIKYQKTTPFLKTIDLIGDSFSIPGLLSPTDVLSMGEYLVVCDPECDTAGIVHIFDHKTLEHLSSILRKGRGPNEAFGLNMICQAERYPHNNMWVVGYPHFVGNLNIDSCANLNKAVFDEKIDFREHNMRILHSSNVAYHTNNDNLLLLMDFERSRTHNNHPNAFYITYDYKNRIASDTIYISEFKKIPQEGSSLIIKSIWESSRKDFKKAVIAFSFLDRIHFVDLESGDIVALGVKEMPKSDLESGYITKPLYGGVVTDDNMVFVLGRDEKVNNGNSYFYVFDWSGNSLIKINLDKRIMCPSLNDEGMLYCLAMDGTANIIKYDFNIVLGSVSEITQNKTD